VTINFNNHSLFLTNPAATGIYAEDVEEITILNDKISTPNVSDSETSYAIHFVGVTKATIDNIFTENTLFGVGLDNCEDVLETNSHHSNHIGSDLGTGVITSDSQAISLDNVVFEGNSGENQFASAGIAFLGGSNYSVTNSKFDDVDLGLFSLVNGLIIDNCLFTAPSTSFFNAIQLGGTTSSANDTIIRNTTVINHDAFVGFDGITCPNGSGLIMENVIVDTNTSLDETDNYLPAAIHFGDNSSEPYTSFTDALLTNVIILNENDAGLFLASASNVVFQDGQITGSNEANVRFSLATECTIKNSEISNGDGFGILMFAGANNNAILGNTVTANGSGVFVNFGAIGNHFQDNKVFENASVGINNAEPSTEFYFNTSCNNGNFNCSPPTALFPQQSPGDSPAVAGSNICCPSPG